VTRRHEVDLARADEVVDAAGVAVFDLAVEQPADGLQRRVRVRRHVHAAGRLHEVGPVVVGEAPGADEGALQLWERAADGHRVGSFAEGDELGRKVLDVRRRVGVVLAVDELGCGFDVAHGRSFVRTLHATCDGGAVGRNGGGDRRWCRRRRQHE